MQRCEKYLFRQFKFYFFSGLLFIVYRICLISLLLYLPKDSFWGMSGRISLFEYSFEALSQEE